jgi:hypothetical protein
MKARQTTVRGAPSRTESGLVELTNTQLDWVSGGGGKPSVGTAGSGGNAQVLHHSGELSVGTGGVSPDGGKGGVQGDLG